MKKRISRFAFFWLLLVSLSGCVGPRPLVIQERLAPPQAPDHPHNRARAVFLTMDDVVQPAPAPRLSRTPAAIQGAPPQPGQDTEQVLLDWGFSQEEIAGLRDAGAIE